MASILQTAFELGLISSLTVLALFLSYTMLNVCDLSTDGCFTLGAAVSGKGGNDSFGVIALVAMMPLLAIQLMGIIYKLKQGGKK